MSSVQTFITIMLSGLKGAFFWQSLKLYCLSFVDKSVGVLFRCCLLFLCTGMVNNSSLGKTN